MGIFGGLGSGKTLTLTYFLWKYRKNPVYANYHLGFDYSYIEDPEALLNVSEGYLGLDELWAWMDSRVSGSKKNRILGHFLLTSRKRNCHVLYTTQHFKQVDVRVRNITDILVFPKYDSKSKTLAIEMVSQYDPKFHRKFSIDARPLFKIYNTNEEIKYQAGSDDCGHGIEKRSKGT